MITKRCYGQQNDKVYLRDTKQKWELAFLNLQNSFNKNRKTNCDWYQEPTNTGPILKFTNCAPLLYKRSVIEGTVHRVFRSTSTWEDYDKAIKINRKQWLNNHYPENLFSRVASQALEKIIIIGEGRNKKKMAEKKKPCDYSSDWSPILAKMGDWSLSDWSLRH